MFLDKNARYFGIPRGNIAKKPVLGENEGKTAIRKANEKGYRVNT